MKTRSSIFSTAILILGLGSCNLFQPDDPAPVEGQLPDISVNQLLSEASFFSNLPTRVRHFQLNSLLSKTDKYYDEEGKDFFNVSLGDGDLDTLSVAIYTYSQGILQEVNSYPFDGEKYTYGNKLIYEYDEKGRLREQWNGNKLLKTYEYDEQDRVSRILLGPNTNAIEAYYFYYDEEDRIIRQIWAADNPLESPFRDWHYIYDESGKLLSKSIPINAEGDLRPMFVYSYDDQHRLIMEEELYPEYGFTDWFSTTYEYGD